MGMLAVSASVSVAARFLGQLATGRTALVPVTVHDAQDETAVLPEDGADVRISASADRITKRVETIRSVGALHADLGEKQGGTFPF